MAASRSIAGAQINKWPDSRRRFVSISLTKRRRLLLLLLYFCDRQE